MPNRSYRWEWEYTATRAGRLRPTVPVVITYARSAQAVHGLVDSGAEWSMCGADLAREAGLDVERFPLVRIDLAGG